MRTTVTLDPDVDKLLKDAMHLNKSNFKETLNQAIRKGLNSKGIKRKKFKVKPFKLELRPGIDETRFNTIADELMDSDVLRTMEHKQSYGEK